LTGSGRVGATAASTILLGGQFGCLMLSQSLFELCRRLKLWFFGTAGGLRTWRQIPCCSASFCFSLVEVRQHTLVVLLYYFLGYPFHAKDLNIQSGAVWECIFDGSEIFFMHLIHMHIEAWCVSACCSNT